MICHDAFKLSWAACMYTFVSVF
uniref:Uncharacterized protein n=1 Tax=Anguilla anguilla TaxID=7936 RepID=A0A0E9W275_ANGAN